MISENVKEKEKVEIYSNGPWVFVCVESICFSPLGKRENVASVIPSGYEQVDVKNVSIWRLPNSKIVVITTEYYDLYVDQGKYFLHLDDRAHPEYTFAITFRISPDMFAELVSYTFAHAKKLRSYEENKK